MRVFVLLVLLVCVSAAAPASAQSGRDGNWWKNMDSLGPTDAALVKRTYAAGVLDGVTETGVALANIGALFVGATSDDFPKTYNALVARFSHGITPRQLEDGLDAFFADFRNRRIDVSDAAFVVLAQIAAIPQPAIDAVIERLRAEPSVN